MAKEWFRPGDYLMIDEESGFRMWASESVIRWDGVYVHKDNTEFRNPQEFVMGRRDPKALKHVSIDSQDARYENIRPVFADANNTVLAPTGPAAHLFPTEQDGQGHSAGSPTITEN